MVAGTISGPAGNLHIERNGDQSWLTTSDAPENVLPKVRAYWLSQGFTLTTDDPRTGILETDWKESRTKLPSDGIRNILSNMLVSRPPLPMQPRRRCAALAPFPRPAPQTPVRGPTRKTR